MWSSLHSFTVLLVLSSCLANGELSKIKTSPKCRAGPKSSSSPPTSQGKQPTLYLFGDSTMSACRTGPAYATTTAGWGTPLASHMTIKVDNDARSGYSARQAYNEKIYDAAISKAQPGDFAILQWGRNDVNGGAKKPCDVKNNNFNTICKGDSPSEPQVFTFVKYLVMATQALQKKGVIVIIASLSAQNTFPTADEKFKSEQNPFVDYAKQAAELTKATYIDMHTAMTQRYESANGGRVKHFYLPIVKGQKPDLTHTTPRGAMVAAETFIKALLKSNSELNKFVKPTPSPVVSAVCH